MSTQIDTQHLESMLGIPGETAQELVDELIAAFGQARQRHENALNQAIAAQDIGKLANAAHALKGSSLTLGATTLAQLCEQIENKARAQTPAEQLEPMCAKIAQTIDQTLSQLGTWQRNRT